MNGIAHVLTVELIAQGMMIGSIATFAKGTSGGISGSHVRLDARKKRDFIMINGPSIVVSVVKCFVDNSVAPFSDKDIYKCILRTHLLNFLIYNFEENNKI